jgi:hypothetical protein
MPVTAGRVVPLTSEPTGSMSLVCAARQPQPHRCLALSGQTTVMVDFVENT